MPSFLDAYNGAVDVSVQDRPDIVCADCNALSSVDIAIAKSMEQVGRKDVLLVFDSLTSPYLSGHSGILKFMRRYSARGWVTPIVSGSSGGEA